MDLNFLNTSQISNLFDRYVDHEKDSQDLPSHLQGNEHKLKKLFSDSPPWSLWYDLPYNIFIIISLESQGALQPFLHALKSENPAESSLNIFDTHGEFSDEEINKLDDMEKGLITSLYFAAQFNLQSISLFGKYINELVHNAAEVTWVGPS